MRDFHQPGRSPVIAENGMAATSHPLATATAIAILKEGGNAIDAALAASATLCVVEPQMTGIGGDCFVIVAEPDGTVHGLNGSGRAPAAAEAAWYRDNGYARMPLLGAHAVTAPGAVDAWAKLSERFGTLPFERLFADAIRYAEDGFAIHARVAHDWRRVVALLAADPGCARHCLADGAAPLAGQRFSFPALARTLRAIARDGRPAFYEGEIAAEIAATVRAGGGFLDEADLAAVSADWVTPIAVRYQGYDVLEIPPNGQGVTALILMRLLERAGIAALAPDSAERHHLQIEAGRLAYSVRDHLVADPASMNCTVDQLLSDRFIDGLAAQFSAERRNPSIGAPEIPGSDTVYLTVVDRDRRAVSFINSVYHNFGAKLATERSGVVLQNRGAGFTIEDGHPNELRGGRRPMHTIIPAMALKNGRPAISFGVMGGDYQPMGHAHVLTNVALYGMDPQAALDHARLFWAEDGTLEAERGIGGDVRDRLTRLGHSVRQADAPHGGGQVIVIDDANGFLVGGSDPRKDGCALGW